MMWWGRDIAMMGWSYLLYEYLYVPLTTWLGAAPWGLVSLGLTYIAIGVLLSAFQLAIGAAPEAR